eukprot:TRINITY_DN20805_c0_g1_i1.p2 TRINITY_DN20805_c0_g1~~TRINITY_DN20805_c0_g1_i1.p2  ORF type:complete len:492 (+),score=135.68 TRINITY_DN20805_c0_g1_i1:71-1546(+)
MSRRTAAAAAGFGGLAVVLTLAHSVDNRAAAPAPPPPPSKAAQPPTQLVPPPSSPSPLPPVPPPPQQLTSPSPPPPLPPTASPRTPVPPPPPPVLQPASTPAPTLARTEQPPRPAAGPRRVPARRARRAATATAAPSGCPSVGSIDARPLRLPEHAAAMAPATLSEAARLNDGMVFARMWRPKKHDAPPSDMSRNMLEHFVRVMPAATPLHSWEPPGSCVLRVLPAGGRVVCLPLPPPCSCPPGRPPTACHCAKPTHSAVSGARSLKLRMLVSTPAAFSCIKRVCAPSQVWTDPSFSRCKYFVLQAVLSAQHVRSVFWMDDDTALLRPPASWLRRPEVAEADVSGCAEHKRGLNLGLTLFRRGALPAISVLLELLHDERTPVGWSDEQPLLGHLLRGLDCSRCKPLTDSQRQVVANSSTRPPYARGAAWDWGEHACRSSNKKSVVPWRAAAERRGLLSAHASGGCTAHKNGKAGFLDEMGAWINATTDGAT